MLAIRVLADCMHHLNTTHAGHFFIEKGDIDSFVMKRFKRCRSIDGKDDLVSIALELVGGQRTNVFLIVGKQNSPKGLLVKWFVTAGMIRRFCTPEDMRVGNYVPVCRGRLSVEAGATYE
jgi:hypothetical protein